MVHNVQCCDTNELESSYNVRYLFFQMFFKRGNGEPNTTNYKSAVCVSEKRKLRRITGEFLLLGSCSLILNHIYAHEYNTSGHFVIPCCNVPIKSIPPVIWRITAWTKEVVISWLIYKLLKAIARKLHVDYYVQDITVTAQL